MRRGETRRAVPRQARGVLLIARLADLYLARLRRAGWDPRDPGVDVGLLRKQTAMLAGALTGATQSVQLREGARSDDICPECCCDVP